jgi:hypothetical protein
MAPNLDCFAQIKSDFLDAPTTPHHSKIEDQEIILNEGP